MFLTSLPNEILYLITKELGTSDLNSFLRLSRHFYCLAKPLLKKIFHDEVGERLIRAVDAGDKRKVLSLIKNGADVNDYSNVPGGGRLHTVMPLTHVIREEKFSMAKFLLENGAVGDPAEKDFLLLETILNSNYLMTKLLLDNGFSPNSPNICQPEDHEGFVLLWVVRYRDRAMVELLLCYDINLWAIDEYGRDSLEIARYHRQHALLWKEKLNQRTELGDGGLDLEEFGRWGRWGRERTGAQELEADGREYAVHEQALHEKEIEYEELEEVLDGGWPEDLSKTPSILRLLEVATNTRAIDGGAERLHKLLMDRVMAEIASREALEDTA